MNLIHEALVLLGIHEVYLNPPIVVMFNIQCFSFFTEIEAAVSFTSIFLLVFFGENIKNKEAFDTLKAQCSQSIRGPVSNPQTLTYSSRI